MVMSLGRKKKRFSSEYTMLSIIEYLFNNAQKTPVTKFNIVTNTPGIKQQRPDRINLMMELLVRNHYLKTIVTSNATYYQITEKGIDAYLNWMKDFLEFARDSNDSLHQDKKLSSFYMLLN